MIEGLKIDETGVRKGVEVVLMYTRGGDCVVRHC
jgi:hypothetical protein